MTPEQEQKIINRAKAEYRVGDPIDEAMHPLYQAQCEKMNMEAEIQRREYAARMRQVVESVDDLEKEFKGCIALRFGFKGSIREVQSITRQEAEKLLAGLPEDRKAAVLKEFRGSKRLLSRGGFPIWENLKAMRTKWVNMIKSFGIPFAVDGMTVVKIERIPEIEELLDVIETTHAIMTEEMIELYPEATSKDAVESELYDPTDYPKPESLAPRFKVIRQWAHFGVPEILKEIDPARWEAERKRTAEMWQEIKAKGILAMRKMVADMTARLVEAVTPDEKTGEKKRFYATSLTNLTEFFATFENRNIAGDVELAAEVEKLKKLIEGKDLEKFKSDEAVRETVREEGAEITAKLQEMVVLASDRVVTFED